MSRTRRILIVVAALALAVPTAATATPNSPDHNIDKVGTAGPVGTTFRPGILDNAGTVNVMVQLKGDPVAVAEAKADRTFSRADRTHVKQSLRKAQDTISDAIAAKGGRVLSHLQSAYNGMRVQIARGKVSSLAGLPGVIGVHTITPRSLDNAVSVPSLGVPQVWQSTGYTGKRVKVGIIDTGIDYTHADFGGPGTPAAFDTAAATSAQAADPALFGAGAPRVKGGYDFVGDAYDANAGSAAATPKPDPNPLDCNGHGSHVAGTAGGGGVTTDGTAYTGPYNSATPTKKFTVGPGVAPEVDLYALRVFGCEGSTDVVTEAIDWAVDHQLDVVNISIGSPFGRSDAPDAVAASNAIGAGVVVVASAGNSGQNPYLAGAPGVGEGVIAVSAVDSTATFPGAKLQLASTSVTAINANGADLPTGALRIVPLVDDPGTDQENEALGCSTAAFAFAGITVGGASKVIAVVDRGVCNRAAKAVYGQQAGADAVVMINDTTELPPYEGQIAINPDDGTAYAVTIPFLGVSSTSGPILVGSAGQTLTLKSAAVDNPAFSHYAPFSSAGPETGDSGLSPNVAAPGVSISSAGVGTGSDAAIISGTSMAAPHVTGVAALGVQAHPAWSAADVAAAVANTADPDKVADYSVALGGGLVDAAQAVATSTFVTGDRFRTTFGRVAESTLSFGFTEPKRAFTGTRTLTIHNRGTKAVRYTLANDAAADSVSAKLRFSSRTVRVRAGGDATVAVTLAVKASAVGSSLTADGFGLHTVSGAVKLTSSDGTLRVPYLLVPRARANVSGTVAGSRSQSATPTSIGPLARQVTLANRGGALTAVADFYTWGLTDGQDVGEASGGSGYDLRAAGVQSFDSPGGKFIVFAVNNFDRWSSPASQEFDIAVDADNDGTPEYVVYSFDSGASAGGDFNGQPQVFIYDVATGRTSTDGYAPVAPTDSSTILVPVNSASIGLGADTGAFNYTVASYTAEDAAASDQFSGWASYDPWARAITDGAYEQVTRKGRITVRVTIDPVAFTAQKPKGVMVVVMDNKSGPKEALLLGVR